MSALISNCQIDDVCEYKLKNYLIKKITIIKLKFLLFYSNNLDFLKFAICVKFFKLRYFLNCLYLILIIRNKNGSHLKLKKQINHYKVLCILT